MFWWCFLQCKVGKELRCHYYSINKHVNCQYFHDCNCVKIFGTARSGERLVININLLYSDMYVLVLYLDNWKLKV